MSEIYMALLATLVFLLAVVVFQSRGDKMNFTLYAQRMSRLIVSILTYFKDVGVCAANKFRQIDWDVTKVSQPKTNVSAPSPTNIIQQ